MTGSASEGDQVTQKQQIFVAAYLSVFGMALAIWLVLIASTESAPRALAIAVEVLCWIAGFALAPTRPSSPTHRGLVAGRTSLVVVALGVVAIAAVSHPAKVYVLAVALPSVMGYIAGTLVRAAKAPAADRERQ